MDSGESSGLGGVHGSVTQPSLVPESARANSLGFSLSLSPISASLSLSLRQDRQEVQFPQVQAQEVGARKRCSGTISLKELVEKTGFSMEDVLRKYIRYTLNEKPFNPELADCARKRYNVVALSSCLEYIGYSERGFKRKLAVQALFGKVFYLSELTEFCSRDSSLIVKEIFGVTDEDADKLRLHTLSEAGDMDSLEKMINDSDSEDAGEDVVEGSPDAS
ncbi:hypothetical protein LWI28_015919 [Acer negundo]|uniref:Armadillo-like repeats domain-containing protein n=1 Tax=Acer negundo TaxID=4023 RepID=A0AAD5IMU1_ACENE|nr:hypothetical protein LWI28_015919 [Acer negundo]